MNIKFYYNKQDFHKNNGVKLTDEKIQNMIDDVVKRLNNSGEYSFSATGDTIVIGFRWEKEINIYVCRNYEHAEAWIDKNGHYQKMDWLETEIERDEEYRQYQNYSKEELIDILMDKRKQNRPVYNPHREV